MKRPKRKYSKGQVVVQRTDCQDLVKITDFGWDSDRKRWRYWFDRGYTDLLESEIRALTAREKGKP